MLNEIEVPSSTSPLELNFKARTDNSRPLAWMLFVFLLGCLGLTFGIDSLKRFQAPSNPIANQFLLSEGKHYWVLSNKEKCLGVVVGGWKKNAKGGEAISFKFKLQADINLTQQNGFIKAKFGEYKNLTAFKGNLNGKVLALSAGSWRGFDNAPNELMLLVDGPDGSRRLKLPSPWDRELNSFFGAYINQQRELIEVDAVQFKECVQELKI